MGRAGIISRRPVPQLALALGGGAALGYAHVGVVRAFCEAGLWQNIDLLVGTSMGALVGAVAITSPSPQEVARRFRVALADPYLYNLDFEYLIQDRDDSVWAAWFGRLKRGLMLTQSILRDSIVDAETFDRMLCALLPPFRIEDLARRFVCISTDLTHRRRHIWSTGPLLDAVAASCAIPGLFPSRRVGSSLHVDGGSVERVPVLAARELGATFVVAVSIEPPPHTQEPDTAAELFVAAANVTVEHLVALQLRTADVIVRPDVTGLHWADFRRFDDPVERGYVAGRAAVEEIRALWQDHLDSNKGVRSWLRRVRRGRS